MLQLLALFWVVKFTWAPLLDRYGFRRLGHYRGWLLILQGLMVMAVVLLLPLDVGEDLPLIFGLVATIAFLSATQDVATDATAVKVLHASERGLGNGIQLASGYFGFIVGGGGILVIYDHLGWPAAVGVLAFATAVPIPFLLRYREAQPDVGGTVQRRRTVSLSALANFFHQPGVARWLLIVLPLNYMGIATAYKLITPMLVDAGWPLDRIGAVVAFGGGAVAMASALSAGAVLNAIGRRTALLAFGAVAAAAIAMLALISGRAPVAVVLGAVALVNVAYASVGTAIFTMSMDWSRRDTAGTDYTVQTSFAVLCSDVAGATGLSLAGYAGYTTVIAASLTLALGGMAAAAWFLSEPPVLEPTDAPVPVPLA
jgi:predicted MFS family arabinose efflux permease